MSKDNAQDGVVVMVVVVSEDREPPSRGVVLVNRPIQVVHLAPQEPANDHHVLHGEHLAGTHGYYGLGTAMYLLALFEAAGIETP